MNARAKIMLSAAGLAALLWAPASAAVYTATYTGTVSSGFDSTGVFGVAATSLTGDAFTAVYTYNTALGVRATVPGVSDSVTGGSYISQPSVASATLTINGVTVSFSGAQASSADAEPGYVAEYAGSTVSDYVDNNVYAATLTATLDETSAFTVGTAAHPDYFSIAAGGQTASGAFNTDTIQIDAAPEPATWAMMLVGVGLTGARLRRVRRRPLAAR